MRFLPLPILALGTLCSLQGATIDRINFGNLESEKAHNFNDSGATQIVDGKSARIINPPATEYFESEALKFTLKVNPDKQNFVTIRLSGDDVNENSLILYIDGKQLGYRHLGDYDILDHGSSAPQIPNRFYYVTTPIPLSATKGKTSINIELRANGRIWGYGRDFAQYQKPMTKPSRELYKLYTHDEPFFTPDSDDIEGTAPKLTKFNDDKVDFSDFKKRVNGELTKLINSKAINNQMRTEYLAKCYFIDWTSAYKNPKTVNTIINSIDEYYRKAQQNPKLIYEDKTTWNPSWFGFGPLASAFKMLYTEISPRLDEEILDAQGNKVKRRDAYNELFSASLKQLLEGRRSYTNQSMIIDRNLYSSNRALLLLESSNAITEAEALAILEEACGLKPWRGQFKDGKWTYPLGKNFYTVTPKGLTRELGFVGSYGEVLDLVGAIYEATCPTPGTEGSKVIKDALIKIAKARSYFRYPALTKEGYPVMRMQSAVGWRDSLPLGEIIYAQRTSREGGSLDVAMMTLDPTILSLAQKMFDENQFFANFTDKITSESGGNAYRTMIGLTDTVNNYRDFKKLNLKNGKAPFEFNSPNFVYADELAGVVAIKYNDEILYASLFYRARHGVNYLAKIHYMTPTFEKIATVPVKIEFEKENVTYTRRNWINFGFGNGGTHIHYPNEKTLKSLHTGEVLEVAKYPEELKYNEKQETPFAGIGEYYLLSYGPYVIAMNNTDNKTYKYTVPTGSWIDVATSAKVQANSVINIKPNTTMVIRNAN